LQAFGECATAGSEIQDARARRRIATRDFHDLLMRAGKSSYQARGLLATLVGIPDILSGRQRAITS
jgi:hypothetical protein